MPGQYASEKYELFQSWASETRHMKFGFLKCEVDRWRKHGIWCLVVSVGLLLVGGLPFRDKSDPDFVAEVCATTAGVIVGVVGLALFSRIEVLAERREVYNGVVWDTVKSEGFAGRFLLKMSPRPIIGSTLFGLQAVHRYSVQEITMVQPRNGYDPVAFSDDDIRYLPGIIRRLTQRSDPVSRYLWERLSNENQTTLCSDPKLSGAKANSRHIHIIAQLLNTILTESCFYAPERFEGVALRPETSELLTQQVPGSGSKLLNRYLLEDAFPLELLNILKGRLPPLVMTFAFRQGQWVLRSLSFAGRNIDVCPCANIFIEDGITGIEVIAGRLDTFYKRLREIGRSLSPLGAGALRTYVCLQVADPSALNQAGELSDLGKLGAMAGAATGLSAMAGAVAGEAISNAAKQSEQTEDERQKRLRTAVFGENKNGSDSLAKIAKEYSWTIVTPVPSINEAFLRSSQTDSSISIGE